MIDDGGLNFESLHVRTFSKIMIFFENEINNVIFLQNKII